MSLLEPEGIFLLRIHLNVYSTPLPIHPLPLSSISLNNTNTNNSVLWKITPLFAEWISNPSNALWTSGSLTNDSIVTELGCGISALIPLTLAPAVQHYIATDQEYVRRLFRTNLDENANTASKAKGKSSTKGKAKKQGSTKSASTAASASNSNITFTTLDWELDQPDLLKGCIETDSRAAEDEDKGFDLLLSCDCIYNDALVAPFVRTCAEICRLRPSYSAGVESDGRQPTVCIIAQQQRSPEVFEEWLRETLREFRVWRLSDEVLGEGMKSGTGYLVHLLLMR